MQIRIHEDVDAFLAVADPFIRDDPFSTSVISVTAQRTQRDAVRRTDCLWVTIEDGDANVIGVAMHTPPFPVFLSRMPAEAAVLVAQRLLDMQPELPGVNGVCEATTAFAGFWTEQTGRASTVVHAMRMYSLEELDPPADVSGHAAAATPGDMDLLVGWFQSFQREALPHEPGGDRDHRPVIERRIAASELHLWIDGGRPVSFAAVTAPAAGVARIAPVYTPPEARRNGYGAALTAAASTAAIAAGARHVVLYADLANPTSNGIYQAIGFRPNHDGESRLFAGPSG
jgi:predicted GNAT family acetyltransferase